MAKAKQSEPTFTLEINSLEAHLIMGMCQNPPEDFGQKEKDAMESIFNALKRANPDWGIR
jgi:hypothetical protein